MALELLSAVALAVPVGAVMYFGVFARYMADDYCMAATVTQMGFWKAQASWYMGWTGRFAFTLVISLLSFAGAFISRILPALALAIWAGALTWTCWQALSILGLRRPAVPAFLLAELVLVATLSILPTLRAPIQWQNGLVNYVLPLIVLTLAAGVGLRACRQPGMTRRPHFWLMVALTFVAGGFSETTLVLQILTLVVLTAVSVARRPSAGKPTILQMLAAAWLGSAVAAVIVTFAPGNQVRLTELPPRPDLLAAAIASFKYAVLFVLRAVVRAPFFVAAVAFVPALLAVVHGRGEARGMPTDPRPPLRRYLYLGILASLACLGLIVATHFPSVYGYALRRPPDRTLVVPAFVLVTSGVLVSYAFGYVVAELLRDGWRLPARALLAAVAIPILLIPPAIGMSARVAAAIPSARTYALRWDARDLSIREAVRNGEKEISAAVLGHVEGVWDIEESSGFWVNQCMAQYYGIKSIEGTR